MIKKSLVAVAVVVLAMVIPALAGDTKIHDPWPTSYTPLAVCTIDVILDAGVYIHIKDQKPIKVSQSSIDGGNPYFTYYGCKKTDIICNMQTYISASVRGTSAAGGSWSATFDGVKALRVDPGVINVEICVLGTDVRIEKLIGGEKNKKVAEVTIQVMVPASA